MDYKNILITGGAGFIGSNLAIKLKADFPACNIICFDNLKRRGSELNLPRLKSQGITFIHGDIRNKEDFEELISCELMIECSAEPSVLAGINSSTQYLINTNLFGAVNCFEFARKYRAAIIFLSTSRIYPIDKLNNLNFREEKKRFSLVKKQKITGVSEAGISENFPLAGARSLYGATKLSAELLLQEYMDAYKIGGAINRCGVIAGPWQMAKVDQGFVILWLAKHHFKKKLAYLGFGGEGKQVRDVLHIDDLYTLIKIQISGLKKFNGKIFNVGGGKKNSVSLQELTSFCQDITGNKITIRRVKENRPMDVKNYISDCRLIQNLSGWRVRHSLTKILYDSYRWIQQNEAQLKTILA